MAEKTIEERFEEVVADNVGMKNSLLKLQTQLDEALQREVDTAAAHEKAISDLNEKHVESIKDVEQRSKETLDATVKELTEKHDDFVADLKAKTLLPAMMDLQKRQADDLKAKHVAELEAL